MNGSVRKNQGLGQPLTTHAEPTLVPVLLYSSISDLARGGRPRSKVSVLAGDSWSLAAQLGQG
jgi:hypothetical protein